MIFAPGDKLMVSGSNLDYRVKGIMPYNYAPISYYEVMLTLPEV